MLRLIIVRHGYVEGIRPERFRGRTDVPLTELGVAQARLTAQRVASEWTPSAIYTSPLQRCVETGRAIAEATGAPVEAIAELQDIDYGEWQWKTFEEARIDSPAMFDLWFSAPHLVRFPNGESLQDLVVRTADALRLTFQRHAEGSVVLVGHDSVNRALLLQLMDLPLSAYWRLAQSPCAISELVVESGVARVLGLNETHHLTAPTA